MRVSPAVAIAVVAVVLIVAALIIWKGTSVGRYPPPPPIQSGMPSGTEAVGKSSAANGGLQPLTPGTQLPAPGAPAAGR